MAVPFFMIGRDYTNITIAPLTVTVATGAVAAHAGWTVQPHTTTGTVNAHTISLCVVDDFDFQYTRYTENLSGCNSFNAHHVPLGEAASFSIREVVRYSGSLLAQVFDNEAGGVENSVTPYARVTFSRGWRTWTVDVAMTGLTYRVSKGKTIASLSCTIIDTQTAATPSVKAATYA